MKKLNSNLVKEKLGEYGYNQSSLSKELGVSREAVSQWLNNKSTPKPAKLLQLSKLLKLNYSEIIGHDKQNEPVVAFRKVRGAKTTNEHILRAKQTGYALEKLVKYLPTSMMIKPPELKNAKNNYKYIQEAAAIIKEKFNLNSSKIEFTEIIQLLNSLNVIIIPVLLGNKKAHENALHIYLPKSQTTWVYVNLDTSIFDFKFWLVHELGHVLTPKLSENAGEKFADNFAGAFLFPQNLAKDKYIELKRFGTIGVRINSILETAKELVISPVTIQKEIDKFAEKENLPKIIFGRSFHGAVTNFNKKFEPVSSTIFGTAEIEAEKYINKSKQIFGTIFFDLLSEYNKKKGLREGFVQQTLNISLIDAKEICSHIINASK